MDTEARRSKLVLWIFNYRRKDIKDNFRQKVQHQSYCKRKC